MSVKYFSVAVKSAPITAALWIPDAMTLGR